MLDAVRFAPPPPLAAPDLRREVRAFLAEQLADLPPRRRALSWMGGDPAFSRSVGAQGWIGMTWPRRYGGHERSALDRYVVMEELLAAGAPVGAHWIADRQSGPLLLQRGTEEQRMRVLPRIVAGECFFCIGMSEPDAGSDLAAVRTRAVEVENGYLVNGTKLWTTGAHLAHYMVLFCRTGKAADERRAGTSQFLLNLTTPGVTIRPVTDMTGAHHFNEVVLDDVFLPADALIGRAGEGWEQVMSELALERSGPERFFSSMELLKQLCQVIGRDPSDQAAEAVGRIVAHVITLRRLSQSVAGMLERGENPSVQAVIVKDLGATLEQEIPEIARRLVAVEPDMGAASEFAATLAVTLLTAPSFSLRGGTREILRGIIARGLGLR